jgi:hypothetical protein
MWAQQLKRASWWRMRIAPGGVSNETSSLHSCAGASGAARSTDAATAAKKAVLTAHLLPVGGVRTTWGGAVAPGRDRP